MKKLFFALLVFLCVFSYFPKVAFADSNFSTDYNVVYTISNNANTHVNINATLINLTDKYYVSSYSIQIGFTDIQNLTASDATGKITPVIQKTTKGSTITLNFNEQSAGLNSKLNFNLGFDTNQIAENLDNTWNINVPGIANQQDFNTFNSTVYYPAFLGQPTYIKPALLNSTVLASGNKLIFTKGDLGGSGISIAFGSFQVYDLNLTYHIGNKNLFPVSTEIALPPSTNYQDVQITNISPKPSNVKLDKDGNWLAQYILPSSKSSNVQVSGKVKVYLNPKQETLDNKSLQDYLKQQTYWEVNSPKIINLAKDLKTPYAIYEYVVKTLTYDFSRVQTNSPRLGALQVLNNPNSAVCLEFTDLFIALSRAAGIPAREIDGYAYTTNTNQRPLSLTEDVLHAWPEYYDFDKKTWIMVDPTWGNTTAGIDYFDALDFDHIAFVVKGEASDYPIPAGGYKLSSNSPTKDVNVTIGTKFNETPENISSSVQIPDNVISGLPISGYIKILNRGTELIQKTEVDVTSDSLLPKDQVLFDESIPPFGYTVIPISFNRTPILTNSADTIKITVNNNVVYKTIRIMPIFVNKTIVLGGILIAGFGIGLSLIAYLLRSLSLYKRKG
jgi:hypothetical protein